jgi:hypothetical protein
MLRTISVIALILFVLDASAQRTKPVPSLNIKKAQGKIEIDGELNEHDWQLAETAKDFWQNFPYDSSLSLTKTEVRLTYDNDNIYISAACYDSLPGDYVIYSLKRDFAYPLNDAFVISIDPFDDKTNGFSFGITPLGVQREGLIANGGGMGIASSWDNKWYSEVKRQPGKWIVEIAIPFKSIRYKESATVWGINFSRNDLKRNENSAWSPVPRGYNTSSLAYTGKLVWDAPPLKAGANVAIIPYATGSANRDFIAGNDANYEANAGLDAKIGITSSLNLDLTVNPDFSQVEVDRQVTNLTRFSLFFPERRNFFIENSDIFDRFGFRQIRPFFSRRIGLYNGEVVPIIAGARLSGHINRKWRIGVMNMQTARKPSSGLEAQNYTVAALQRTVFARSNIAAIFVNRQGSIDNKISYSDYNRVAGLDFNLASKNNRWQGKAFYHQAFTPGQPGNSSANATWLNYITSNAYLEWNHEYVGENYSAEVGFTPRIFQYNPLLNITERKSYWRLEPIANYKFYPRSKHINTHGPGFYLSYYMDKDLKLTDYILQLQYKISFQNTAILEAKLQDNFTRLPYPIDITFAGLSPIPALGYKYQNAILAYTSSAIKRLYATITADYGTFYNGTKLSFSGEVNYRRQPWGILAMNFSRDEIRLPGTYRDAYLTLIGPRIELSFSRSLFFTTFVQYNTQIENLNINSRLQWRFRPMSDLYLVYTDNYNAIDLGKKNKALILKLTYWLSI